MQGPDKAPGNPLARFPSAPGERGQSGERLEAGPRLIGVIDLMGGVAVRAVGGRRDEYRPVSSRLCDSPDPLRIAAAYRERYGIEDLYVADLDAILGRPLNADVLAGLAAVGFNLAVDAGLRSADDAAALVSLGVESVVAGLETLTGPAVLIKLVERFGPDRVVFSLDLAAGVPLGDPERWGEDRWDADSPFRIATRAIEAGITRLIVLDLRAVGTAAGPATDGLSRRIKRSLPQARLWTGGGVRGGADVETLLKAGAEGVLVASALHDGTFRQAASASSASPTSLRRPSRVTR